MAFWCHYPNQLAFIRSIKHQFTLFNSSQSICNMALFLFLYHKNNHMLHPIGKKVWWINGMELKILKNSNWNGSSNEMMNCFEFRFAYSIRFRSIALCSRLDPLQCSKVFCPMKLILVEWKWVESKNENGIMQRQRQHQHQNMP